MKQIVLFAVLALVIAGVMPRVMSQVGSAPEPTQSQPKRAEPSRPVNNYRSVTVESDRGGHFQVEGAVDGRRIDLMVDTGATHVALRERDANKLGIGPMGFGGKTTLMGVKIGVLNRLPASFFVSVSYMCWAYRRQGANVCRLAIASTAMKPIL